METPLEPKQISLLVVSFWIKPPCCMKAWTIIVVRLSTFPPSTICWSVSRIGILFHACITYACTKIQDWFSIVITSFALKEKKFAITTIVWICFKTYSNMQFAISRLEPSDQCLMWLSSIFSCANNVCIIVYSIMGRLWRSKWKINGKCIIFFLLTKSWTPPWMTCCNTVSKPFAK